MKFLLIALGLLVATHGAVPRRRGEVEPLEAEPLEQAELEPAEQQERRPR